MAAALLSLLTVPTANAKKNAGPILDAAFPPADEASSTAARDATVAELRDLVTALGRLDAAKVLPPDEEAEAHAREHEEEGISEVLRERREMRQMESLMGGLGNSADEAARKEKTGMEAVAECEERLGVVLRTLGLGGVLGADRS